MIVFSAIKEKITGLSTDVTPQYVKETIEEYLLTFPKKDIRIEVAFYGGALRE